MADLFDDGELTSIIPFGKYRGRPIEALAADKQYSDWLVAQPWFRDRYPSLHTIVINYFKPPEDTPEHNAIQAMFLDKAFCIRLGDLLSDGRISDDIKQRISFLEEHKEKFEKIRAEYERGDANQWKFDNSKREFEGSMKYYGRTLDAFNIYHERDDRTKVRGRAAFEVGGVDVVVEVVWCVNDIMMRYFKASVEIKPTVGDDWPTIMRQMKASKSNVLVYGHYHGAGITEDQFRAIFRNESISPVALAELGVS